MESCKALQPGYRIAVILNEFGAELGIEKMLVQDNMPDGAESAVEEWVAGSDTRPPLLST